MHDGGEETSCDPLHLQDKRSILILQHLLRYDFQNTSYCVFRKRLGTVYSDGIKRLNVKKVQLVTDMYV